jgi:NhaP-type Na+/H+ and K+/H+ antiporter
MLELVRRRSGVRRDYESLYSLGVAFAAFAAAESVHGSGFLAAFAAGLTISAVDVELCDCFLEYGETTAEMALMFAFVLFGTSLIWSGLGIVGAGTLLFAAGVFLARIVAFVPALLPSHLSWKDRSLIAWFGPRGLSSLLLILLPVFAGLPGSDALFTVCCLVVLCSVVLHGLAPIVLIRKNRRDSHGETPAPPVAPVAIQSAAPEPGPIVLKDPEYITLDEIRELQRRSVPVHIVDARSIRSYDESTEEIPGAIRIDPEHAVQSAAQHGIPKEDVLAVLCA